MLHPSYSELIEVVNSGVEEGEQPIVQSRYSIVKATANRAKQIIEARFLEEKFEKLRNSDKESKAPEMSKEDRDKITLGTALIKNADSMKPLSVAVKELGEGKITIAANKSEIEDMF